MDPASQQPQTNDPYAQPQPPQGASAGYTPPPQLDDYTQLTQQPNDPYALSQNVETAHAEQPQQQQQQHYTEEQAVAWARAKVQAAHHPDVHAIPQQPQSHPSPEQSPPQIPVQPAATTDVQPAPAPAPYSPPEEFATFDIPGTQPEPQQPQPEKISSAPEPVPEPVTAQEAETQEPEKPAKSEPTSQGKIKSLFSGFYENGKPKLPEHIKPIAGAILTGFAVFAIFNSQVILGQIQYIINPGSSDSSNVSAALDEKVGPEPLVIIPKINVSAPVVYDVTTFEEQAVQKGLERGVVHYGNTALPGQLGNNVIVGHSSNNWWASGKYKFAFVLLDKLEVGDTFILNYESKRYVYEITTKKVVDPKDTSVLAQNTTVPITTLITCTPAGTSLNRLIIVGKQISPNPALDQKPTSEQKPAAAADESILPGNTPSIIDKIREWFR